MEVVMLLMSPIIKSTEAHLNQTLERAKPLMDQRRMLRGMNLLVFQLSMVLET